jgi:hypothetical protein
VHPIHIYSHPNGLANVQERAGFQKTEAGGLSCCGVTCTMIQPAIHAPTAMQKFKKIGKFHLLVDLPSP